jgi:hypothetical protein
VVFIFNNNEFNSIKSMEGYVMKKPEITILWGTDREEQKTYVFETEEQKTFFMKGVDEANGWLEYEVLELYEDVKKEVFNG